jgi:acyl-CoA thioesterase-2
MGVRAVPELEVTKLLGLLDLEPLEVNIFRGTSPEDRWQRVFGGQVIGQALMAAQRTVEDRICHSLHAYFLRPGDPKIPILYEVERIRDGKSFTTRRVKAIQHGHAIFSLSASFQVAEAGFDHQSTIPDVPGPDDLQDEQSYRESIAHKIPEAVRTNFLSPRPIEMRPVEPRDFLNPTKRAPQQCIWIRATAPIPEQMAIQQCVLAYASDMTLLDNCLMPHGVSWFRRELQVASLDHAMWFHRPFRTDDWLLYAQDSPSASGARGFNRGSIYDRAGNLVASVAQEGLIRWHGDLPE